MPMGLDKFILGHVTVTQTYKLYKKAGTTVAIRMTADSKLGSSNYAVQSISHGPAANP